MVAKIIIAIARLFRIKKKKTIWIINDKLIQKIIILKLPSENTKNPNSDAQDFKVYPKILRPCEWRENLKIRNTLKTLNVTKADEKNKEVLVSIFWFLNF